jgi:hypothetical protein
MRLSELQQMPEFFDRYIKLVGDLPVVEALEHHADIFAQERSNLISLGDQVYAENKWTAKQILQHCIDTERIMAYRAMRIARHDVTPLPGFDENSFAANADISHKSLADLLHEFSVLRESSILLFRSLSNAALLREGIASNKPITVLALGFTIVGHPLHHLRVLQERYYPLLQ